MTSSLKIASLGVLALVVAACSYGCASASAAAPAMVSPANGFTLHIDAKKHFPGKSDFIAHHWCRATAGGLTECQLYDSDAANARLVGVELVVPTAMWKTFPKSEQALWHYHRVEIPKVSATLPGMSPADAKKVVASLMETYGKIYLLWDPSTQNAPMGQPMVYVLK